MKKRVFLILLLLLPLLAACGGPSGANVYSGKLVKQYGGEKTRPDPAATRRIVLLYPPTGERLDLVYYHDGCYDQAALRKIDALFRDRHANEIFKIDPELIDFLVDIRTRLDLPPNVVFEILSGYRSPATNAMLTVANNQVAKESLHMQGLAVDFRIAGVNGSAIAEIAKTMERGGVSFYPRDNHVHVDIGNIRTWATR
jgi:uncharacterized protein YcbK (DUF882 family)